MQIFAHSKLYFYFLMTFYVIHLKNQGVKFDHSTTIIIISINTIICRQNRQIFSYVLQISNSVILLLLSCTVDINKIWM